MTGSVVERLVPDPLAGNLSEIEREQLEARRVGAAAAVAFGSGALMVSEDSVLTLGDGSTEENQKQQLGLRIGGGGRIGTRLGFRSRVADVQWGSWLVCWRSHTTPFPLHLLHS